MSTLEKNAKMILEGNEDPKLTKFFDGLDKIEAQGRKKQSELDRIEAQWNKIADKIKKGGGNLSYTFEDSLA